MGVGNPIPLTPLLLLSALPLNAASRRSRWTRTRQSSLLLKGQSLRRGTVDELGDAIERQKFYRKTPYLIIDRLSRIVAVLAGQLEGNYAEYLMKVHDAMKTEGANAGLGKGSIEGDHLRGRFPAYDEVLTGAHDVIALGAQMT
ncbi:hypothetical protein BT96DRAFT_998460 [Gymnopus androsaceus JB14]|uniref:Uncharacterized protein n=1 Tax=Gymnopus androsaceus JB14 TaxID=1447944 RepID=A0A6A4HBG1_9AGAR|nr:hypothetical protein BT96DRAFT_998460 [Gymnopus androsaceus JB14]